MTAQGVAPESRAPNESGEKTPKFPQGKPPHRAPHFAHALKASRWLFIVHSRRNRGTPTTLATKGKK